MKKYFGIVSLIIIAICSAIIATSCEGNLTLTSIKVENLGFSQTVMENTDLDVSNISVKAVYENGTKRQIDLKDLKFYQNGVEITDGKLDNTVGEKTLTITYNEHTIEIKYNVVNDVALTYRILSVEKPAFLIDYADNVLNDGSKNEKSVYLDLSDTTYLVGNTNAFHFLPNITAVDENDNDVKVNRYLSNSTVYEKQSDGTYLELVGEDLTNTVTINEVDNTYLFSASSLGKEYKISVVPVNLTAEQAKNSEYYTQEISFKVVEGYNVENLLQFSLIDNTGANNSKNYDYWAEVENRGALETDINAMVIHSNLALTRQDLPDSYFYNEGDSDVASTDEDYARVIDSLRDSLGIYNLTIEKGKTFTLHGNFFTFDTSAIKLSAREYGSNGEKQHVPIKDSELSSFTANTAIFTIGGGDLRTSSTLVGADKLMGNFVINNMKFIGNAQIDSQADPAKYVGALSLTHDRTTGFTNNNVITQSFKTTYFTFGNLTLNYCKGYDCFNSNVHTWASYSSDGTTTIDTGKNNVINNSVFKKSYGPLFMLTQQNPEKGIAEPQLIINDTVLETRVGASDPWFVSYGFGALAGQLLSMNQIFLGISGGTKQFAENDKVNFISVIKGNSQGGATKGFVTITKNGETIGTTDASNPYVAAAPSAYSASPIFSTALETAIYNPNATYKIQSLTGKSDLEMIAGITNGDYMGLYLPGATRMCCMLEYFNVPQEQ